MLHDGARYRLQPPNVTLLTNLGGDPMVEGGGVGLLPALCLRLMAWVLLTLLTDSCLSPSSGAIAGERLPVT